MGEYTKPMNASVNLLNKINKLLTTDQAFFVLYMSVFWVTNKIFYLCPL